MPDYAEIAELEGWQPGTPVRSRPPTRASSPRPSSPQPDGRYPVWWTLKYLNQPPVLVVAYGGNMITAGDVGVVQLPHRDSASGLIAVAGEDAREALAAMLASAQAQRGKACCGRKGKELWQFSVMETPHFSPPLLSPLLRRGFTPDQTEQALLGLAAEAWRRAYEARGNLGKARMFPIFVLVFPFLPTLSPLAATAVAFLARWGNKMGTRVVVADGYPQLERLLAQVDGAAKIGFAPLVFSIGAVSPQAVAAAAKRALPPAHNNPQGLRELALAAVRGDARASSTLAGVAENALRRDPVALATARALGLVRPKKRTKTPFTPLLTRGNPSPDGRYGKYRKRVQGLKPYQLIYWSEGKAYVGIIPTPEWE